MRVTCMLLFEREADATEALKAYLEATVNGGDFRGLKTPQSSQMVHGPWRFYRLGHALLVTVEIDGKPAPFNEDGRLNIQEILFFDMSTDRLMTKLAQDFHVVACPGEDLRMKRTALRDVLPQLRQMALKAEQLVTVAEATAR